MEYVCIAVLLSLNASLQGANFIEAQIVVTIFYTFYRCHKLYLVLTEEATRKLFWISLAVAFGVISIFIISRGLIIVLQDASYVSPAGYYKGHQHIQIVTPIKQYIGLVLYASTVIGQIVL